MSKRDIPDVSGKYLRKIRFSEMPRTFSRGWLEKENNKSNDDSAMFQYHDPEYWKNFKTEKRKIIPNKPIPRDLNKFPQRNIKNMKFTDEQLIELYNDGWNDIEMAQEFKCSYVAITKRRYKLRLKANGKKWGGKILETTEELKEANDRLKKSSKPANIRFHQKNPHYHRDFMRKWRKENPDWHTNSNFNRKNHQESCKIYYNKHKKEILERNKKYYLKHREQLLERVRNYRLLNKDKIKSCARNYYQKIKKILI